jgi:hypothetical protein
LEIKKPESPETYRMPELLRTHIFSAPRKKIRKLDVLFFKNALINGNGPYPIFSAPAIDDVFDLFDKYLSEFQVKTQIEVTAFFLPELP